MRKLIIILVGLAILAVLAYGGRRYYHSWKTGRAVEQAREAIEESRYNEGLLWLRTALQANANNLEAVQMMADFAEMSQSPASVYWRERLMELTPGSVTNRLLLARVAIVHQQFGLGKTALDGVKGADRNSADFHKFTAALAVATGEYQAAEEHFQQAIKLEPNNPVPQLNFAMILVQRTDPQLASQGRQMLESLRANEAMQVDALRHLALDAFRHTNYTRAIALADELVGAPTANFNDRLLYLDVLSASKSPQLVSQLSRFQRAAETNLQQVFALGRWMYDSRGPKETSAWLQSIPPRITTNLPVTMVVADTYQGTGNWVGLQSYVSEQDWGPVEYVRLAFLSRAMREQGLTAASKSEWSKALKSAAGRLDRLRTLQRLALGWRWNSELEEVLWAVINRFPAEKAAVAALSDLLYVSGKSRSLLTLYAQEAKLDPSNLAIKNNLASLALLLDAQQHRPHEMARELYDQQRDNPIFISTYAYSLYVQEQYAQALELMGQLSPEVLEQADIAGYYGLILTGAGEKAKARKYLDLAVQARLLPEETEMFRRAAGG